MTNEFAQRALDKGESGAAWLESIPDLIAEFEKRWSITVGDPFNLSYNYVAPATLSSGDQAVIKIGFPGDAEFKTEIDALRICDGDGMVRLYQADEERSVILIEKLDPGVPVSSLADDKLATRILASTLKRIPRPVPTNHRFPDMTDWARAIKRLRQKYNGTSGPFPTHLVNKAEHLFGELIDSITEPVLVHGDLHHENVLSATREPWLAIDPKGVIAEPAFDCAAILRNLESTLIRVSDLAETLKTRIIILSEELQISSDRIRKWGTAQTVLSSIWTMEDHGRVPEFALKIAETLDTLDL
jgi:streptomycin 6-kinase